MQRRNIFNKAAVAVLLGTTVLATGCQQYQSPEEKAEARLEQWHEQAGVYVHAKTCTVTDMDLKNEWYGDKNVYDFKHAAVHFNSVYPSTMAMKDLGEDGQARAMEMYSYLAGTSCKAPKFGQ